MQKNMTRKWRQRQNHLKFVRFKNAIDSRFFSKQCPIDRQWVYGKGLIGLIDTTTRTKREVVNLLKKFRNRCWYDVGWSDCYMKKKHLTNAINKEMKQELFDWECWQEFDKWEQRAFRNWYFNWNP